METQPLTDKQAITIAGTLGITLLMNYQRLMPPHKLIARKVKAVEDAVSEALDGMQLESITSQRVSAKFVKLRQ